eukprot:CAMPEP_0184741844 /NCGR_PEP_ID=MMETSP0315-20130426/4852_1 /TAXON_ID=101924 /ORGANISM="Rhodosorus marinus, Strain UTEX LB 2760" /LENGTH=1821 /DNA_ID=CAMNT_0027212371 /DNA_START=731 /DNA_END=6196 /DNA_ORIENTATION=-
MSSEGDYEALASKKSFKAFRADLVSALSSFDRAADWADLIRYLQRVNDVLKRHENVGPVIPEQLLLGKRLAQCLDSSFQSGVHLKALETYRNVFTRLGPRELAKSLYIYSSGLFPLLSNSSTPVKRDLLSLYEEYFLPVGSDLRNVLDGLVLALLPGLEDETSEFYSIVLKLLADLQSIVDDDLRFSVSLWRALLLAPNRILALAFLTHCYRKETVPLPPPEIVAPALTAALAEKDSLVQRNVLDFLINYMPPDSHHLGDLRAQVVTKAVESISRNDISLKKRVYAWLCGPEEDQWESYFKEKSFLPTAEALTNLFEEAKLQQSPKGFVKTVKLVLSLFDNEAILNVAADRVISTTMTHGVAARDLSKDTDVDSSMSSFVEYLSPLRILAQLLSAMKSIVAEGGKLTDADFKRFSFGLSYLVFGEEERTSASLMLWEVIEICVSELPTVAEDVECLESALSFCILACNALQPQSLGDSGFSAERAPVLLSFCAFLGNWLDEHVTLATSILWKDYDSVDPMEEERCERSMQESRNEDEQVSVAAVRGCTLIIALSKLVDSADSKNQLVDTVVKCAKARSTRICIAGSAAFLELASRVGSNDAGFLEEQAEMIGFRCWRMFHPELRSSNLTAAELWMSLEARFPTQASAVMADGMLSPVENRRSRNLERYGRLWRLVVEHHLDRAGHDCGLLLMLDALVDRRRTDRMIATMWLTDALYLDPVTVCDQPLHLLLGPETSVNEGTHEYVTYYDAPRALYAFSTLQTVIQKTAELCSRSQKGVILTLESAKPSASTAAGLAALYGGETANDDPSYVSLGELLPAPSNVHAIAITALGFIRAKVPEKMSEGDNGQEGMVGGLGTSSFKTQHAAVSASAAELLATLLYTVKLPFHHTNQYAMVVADVVLNLLAQSVDKRDYVIQFHLLDALEALLVAEGSPFEQETTEDRKLREKRAWTAAEASGLFLPTVLRGLRLSARGVRTGRDSSGLLRRWISFFQNSSQFLEAGLEKYMTSAINEITQLIEDESRLLSESGNSEPNSSALDSFATLADNRLVLFNGLAELLKTTIASFEEYVREKEKANALLEDDQRNGESSVSRRLPKEAAGSSMAESSSLNPLKLLTDLKDMIIGVGPEQGMKTIDPRHEAIQSVFSTLPRVVSCCVNVWSSWKRDVSQGYPSTERLTSKKAAIMTCLEPLLRRHPCDSVASFIALWYQNRIKYPGTNWRDRPEGPDAIDLLLAIPGATAESVTSAICDVFELSLRWDEGSSLAVAAKNRKLKREGHGMRKDPIGGLLKEGVDTEDPESSEGAARHSLKGLLAAGDFFAEFHAANIQTSSLEFLSCFLESCGYQADVVASWPSIYATVKELLTITPRASVVLESLNVLSSYTYAVPKSMIDRRLRKELAHASTISASACNEIGKLDADSQANSTKAESKFEARKPSPQQGFGNGVGGDGSDTLKRAHLMTKAMVANASSLVRLLHSAFEDDRPNGIALLAPAVESAFKILRKPTSGKTISAPHDEVAKSAAAKLLSSCCEYPWALKTIKKGMLALLEESTFFEDKSSALLRTLAETVNCVLDSDKTLLAGLSTQNQGVGAGGITAVFAGRDSDLKSRAKVIRRISFCLFFGEEQQFNAQVSSVLEKLRDALRVRSNNLTVETFLCLRVLLLRTGVQSIKHFRASTLTETIRILEKPFADPMETAAVLRFLDLVTLLQVTDFSYELSFFFDSCATSAGRVSESNAPVSELVARIAETDVAGFQLEEFSHLRMSGSIPVCGGTLSDVSAAFVKAYAMKLCARVVQSNELQSQPDVTMINFELEQEFHQHEFAS